MGKVLSIMIRQSRRVFVQERAERIISKPKPAMHPFYPTEEKIMKQIKEQHPELAEKIAEHRPSLDDRVGALRITSKEVPRVHDGPEAIEGGAGKEVKLLPQVRMAPEETEFGFYEPMQEKIPRGRILFSSAMQLLKLREEKEKAQQFATQCGVNEADTKSILEYFAPFAFSVDLSEEPKKEFLYDEEREKLAVGRRAFIQQERLVSRLEQQRITARLAGKSSDESSPNQASTTNDKLP